VQAEALHPPHRVDEPGFLVLRDNGVGLLVVRRLGRRPPILRATIFAESFTSGAFTRGKLFRGQCRAPAVIARHGYLHPHKGHFSSNAGGPLMIEAPEVEPRSRWQALAPAEAAPAAERRIAGEAARVLLLKEIFKTLGLAVGAGVLLLVVFFALVILWDHRKSSLPCTSSVFVLRPDDVGGRSVKRLRAFHSERALLSSSRATAYEKGHRQSR